MPCRGGFVVRFAAQLTCRTDTRPSCHMLPMLHLRTALDLLPGLLGERVPLIVLRPSTSTVVDLVLLLVLVRLLVLLVLQVLRPAVALVRVGVVACRAKHGVLCFLRLCAM